MHSESSKKENQSIREPLEIESSAPPEKRISDIGNIFLLFFFYLFQGIFLGLIAAVPIILQHRQVSYTEQATFSIISWLHSLKLLWAPFVDTIYYAKFGKRKSWLIPTQYLIGLCMLFISMNLDTLLGDEEGKKPPKIIYLTIAFFVLEFFVVTQDIVVDGWSLSMLNRKNVGYSAICCSIGMNIGHFLGYAVFIVLDSADFCNKWLRSTQQPTGIVSFADYIYFWSVVFIIFNTLVAIFIQDNSLNIVKDEKEFKMTVKQSYQLLLKIIRLESIQGLAIFLLTCQVAFAACSALTSLKLIQVGVPKEKVALMSAPCTLLQILFPLLFRRYIVGPQPLNIMITVYPFRIFAEFILAVLVFITPVLISRHIFSESYYILLLVFITSQMAAHCMYISRSAFFPKVSDPRFGGTYMTLLNTLNNLGGSLPPTLMLWLVDGLTFKRCRTGCKVSDKETCTPEEICEVFIDGYYVEIIVSILIGILWLQWGKIKTKELQTLEDSAWIVNNRVSWIKADAII